MRGTTFAIALTLTLGTAACGVESTSPLTEPHGQHVRSLESSQSAQASSAAPGVAAGSYGAVLTNDETIPFFVHYDAARDLMSVHGGLVELCRGTSLGTAPRMIVDTPSEISQRLVKIGQEEQPVVIYRTETGAFSCALVLAQEARVASGMVRHDQVFTLASFKATWRGTVTAPDGSSHHLTEVYQLTADIHDPNNPALWSLNASQILIQ